MQAIVGENMMNLETATNDQAFMQYQQKKYETIISELHKKQKEA